MKRVIELPDKLAQSLDAYLQKHPDETFFSLVKEALETKLIPKDASKLLTLAGIITEAPHDADEHARYNRTRSLGSIVTRRQGIENKEQKKL